MAQDLQGLNGSSPNSVTQDLKGLNGLRVVQLNPEPDNVKVREKFAARTAFFFKEKVRPPFCAMNKLQCSLTWDLKRTAPVIG